MHSVSYGKMISNLEIRQANRIDFPRIINIWIEEFKKTPWKEKWTKDNVNLTLKKWGSQGRIYVAYYDKTIAGFIVVRESFYVEGPIIILEDFVILKKFQHQGIGTALLKKIETIYKSKKFVNSYVLTMRKAPSYKFYKKRGYKDSKYDASLVKKIK
jgi:ribosomal protein S18 acetylase RimI-like enzyme